MTDIVDVARRVQYTGNGTAGPFSFSFQVNAQTEIKVFVGTTQKTLTTHYTVSLTSSGAGSVTFTSGNFPTSSETITIVSAVGLARSSVYTTGGPLTATALEADFDTNIMILQQSSQKVDRALAAPEFDSTSIDMTLPTANERKGKFLAFNTSTGNPEMGPSTSDVTTLASVTSDIALLADLQDGTTTSNALTTLAGISSNISTVSGISGNVTTVAGIQSNVSSVAGNATNINTVAGSIANVNTVATNIADVNAVAADLAETVSEIETVAADLQETQSEIDTVATNIANVNAVGNSITNVNTTATNISNINTLAGISSNVSTVAGINSDVTTVAGISSNVTAVAGDATDIGTVATNIANVNTVGGISGNVTTVAGISGNVQTVAGISGNVSTVAGIDTAVSTVAGISSNVTSVANDASDIGTVASAISNVNTVAGNTTNINTVAGNNSNISTVGGISSNVTTVAGIASNVTTVAGISSDVTTVANDATDIGTVSTNISNVNTLANALSGTNAYTVTVVNSGGNKFALNGTTNPTLTLKRGITYTFDQSDSSNSGHPLAFKDGSGNAYTNGVTITGTAGQAGAKVVFAVPSNAPSSLLYYCTVHGNAMGNSITVQDDNVAIVAGISSNITTVAGVASNVTTVAGIASNVTTVASNVSGINDFADRYRVASSAPSSNNDEGDLYYNTTSDQLFVYNGSAWISAALDASSALVPSNNLSDVASASTARTNLGISTYGSTLIDDADAAAARTTLGLGTIATQSSVDSNIDTHLNTSTANNNEFLQWSGSDYQWSAVDLSAYLTSSTAASTYAPLSGATFTGNIILPQTGVLAFNSTSDEYIQGGSSSLYLGVDNAYMMHLDGSNDKINFQLSGSLNGDIHYNSNDSFALESTSYLSLKSNVSSTTRGIYFSNTYFKPYNADTGQLDLGTSSAKWKDLHINGTGYSSTAFQAPIFYDANITSYYCDPAGTSLFNYANVVSNFQAGTSSTLNSRGQIGIYASANPFISFHNNSLDRTAYIMESGSAFYLWEATFTEMSGQARAPIFYDSNQTSYYVDPASTSNMYRAIVTDYIYTPIVYDNNNSGYYCDPSSTSNLNYVSVQTDLYLGRALNVNIGGGGASGGTSGQVLTSQGTNAAPQWTDPSGGAWEEVSSTALTGTGQSSTIRNFSVSADVLYRFTFSKFYWVGNADMIAIKLSQDGGSSWKNLYGVKWKRSSWLSMTYSSTQAQTQDRSDLQQRSIPTDPKYGHWVQVYVHTVTNGGAWVWSRTFGKTNSYENNETGARLGVYGEGGTVNYIRLQPGNYFSSSYSSQGMRGHLRVEKWST